MKFLIALLLIGTAIAVNTKAVHHGDKAHKLHKAWAEHKAEHHPELDSPEEEIQLKARFAKTDEMIHKHYSDPNVKHHIGHNHFSTMTNEEKRFHMFGVKKPTNKMDNAWAHHKAKFHPEIDSPKEESVRKAQFVKTHKMIDEHNSDPEATHQLTHNHFSAMTNEEKKKHFFGVKPAVDEQEKVAESEVESAEDDIMVRKIPGTLNKSNAEIMHNLNKLQGLRQPTRRTNPTTTTKKAPYTVTGHFFAHRG